MTHPRILRCIYEGRHRPVSDGFRHPVQLPMSPRMDDPPSAPTPIPYVTIQGCRACNMEERIAHNFEWSTQRRGLGHE